MIDLFDVTTYLDKELNIHSIKDGCQNGLQVEGKREVKKIGFAVDVSLKVLEQAVENKCDLLITHHALIWGGLKTIKGLIAKKLNHLLSNEISLYSAHLPIDAHKKYSHSKLVGSELGLTGLSGFAYEGKKSFGVSGSLRKKMKLYDLADMIKAKLKGEVIVHNYGKEIIDTIGIVSGSGGFAIEECYKDKLNCLITGEMKYSSLLDAKDYGINVIEAGHYETEKFGMIKLSRSITKKFKIQCVFIES